MGASSELRKVLSQRLVPLIADLEELVFRHGYIRVFSGAVAALGSAGLLGQVFGLAWLRIIFATSAGVLFILASAVSFAGTQKLRSRVHRVEALLHDYADATLTSSPTSVREWRQDVTIEENGDAHFRRELTLAAASDGSPRYVFVNLVYYGATQLTELAKRRVKCHAFHAGPENTSERTRANATSKWSTATNGKPRLDIYIHLGKVVQDGDLVTVEWVWPGYSADLMRGIEPEAFDVLFRIQVSKFEHRAVFRNVHNSAFKVRNQGALNLRRIQQGRDVIVEFSALNPEKNQRMGFIADYSHDS